MTVYPTFRLGRLGLSEDFAYSESASATARTISLAGQASMPQKTRAMIEAHRDDILALSSGQEVVPVIFNQKRSLNGMYSISSSSAVLTNWDDFLTTLTWSISALRVGPVTQNDFESRLSGAVTRSNAFTATGKRWHAPPVGERGYWAGATAPISVPRVGADGTVDVYQNLTYGINPRWGVPLENYGLGRCRFIDQNGSERHGMSIETAGNNWEINNSIIRVRPLAVSGTLEISTYVSGTWRPKNWDIQFSTGPAVSVGVADYAVILQNDYHCVTLRLVKNVSPVGRLLIDLTLRRGSSFVEIYLQHEFGTTLVIKRLTTEAGTGSTGYITATSADADGLKYFLASAQTFTGDNVNGGISKASTSTLDAAVGVQLNTTSGNLTADLYQQYLGSPSEAVRVVGR